MQLEDTNWYLLYEPTFWIGVAIALLLWWVPTWVALKALGGTWRSWVLTPPIPFQISARNTWPFMFAAGCAPMSIALLSLPAEILEWEAARLKVWDLLFVPWAFVILSFFWWPLWLSPRWYRSWAKAGGARQTNPWTPDEIATVRTAPPSKNRDKKLSNIERCQFAEAPTR